MLLLLSLVCAVALGGSLPRLSFLRQADFARRRGERAALLAKAAAKTRSSPPPREEYFTQRTNHFGRNHGSTWQQRYWVDNTYYNSALPGPVFVQLGEEGEASAGMASSMAMATYGQTHGALLVAIEHRFYGKSQPTGSFADLSLLSVDQALADFATVIEALSAKYNTTNTIVFGCSYIGSGAAWFRAKYPHLLAGAVASSPPVLAVADFYKYLDQVGLSISEQFGATCNANIAAGYKTLIDTLSSSPSSTVAPFNLCAPPSTALDRATFASSVSGAVMGVVQYDFEFGTNNIPAMCSVIGNASTPYLGLAKFFTSQSPVCNDVLYADMITALTNTTYDPAQNMRQWTYQTCTEFGYFQTTDSKSQPFAYGNMVPLSFYNQMCRDSFGSSFDVESNVADTNSRFGGNLLPSYYATNIAYDNSLVDPWHTLSVQHDVNPASRLFTYDVRGHCAAVSPPQPSDPQSIKNVRSNIAREINKWVAA